MLVLGVSIAYLLVIALAVISLVALASRVVSRKSVVGWTQPR
jgi:hypothetical protein